MEKILQPTKALAKYGRTEVISAVNHQQSSVAGLTDNLSASGSLHTLVVPLANLVIHNKNPHLYRVQCLA